MSGLANCPFCGGEAHIGEDIEYRLWSVRCSADGCLAEGPAEMTKAGATAAWNRRASTTPADVGEEPAGYLNDIGQFRSSHYFKINNIVPSVGSAPLYSATALERAVRDQMNGEAWEREKARAESAEAKLAEARKVISRTLTWAEQRCPCRNEEPNPCPLCGASVENLEACKSAENTLPPTILADLRAARRWIEETK